jgi:hypothetical protein
MHSARLLLVVLVVLVGGLGPGPSIAQLISPPDPPPPAAARQCNSTSRVDVRAFGAIGDGTSDDHAAIQAAIVAASHHPCGGGQVFFPPAIAYLVRRPLLIMAGEGGVARGGLALIGGGGTGRHEGPEFAYAPQTTVVTDVRTGPALQVGNLTEGGGINDVDLLIQDMSFVGVETGLAIVGSAGVRMVNVGAAARNWTSGRDNAGAVISNTYWLSCDQCTFETVRLAMGGAVISLQVALRFLKAVSPG